MNIFHVTTLYPQYIKEFESRNTRLDELSFDEHRALLYQDAFGWCDYLVRHLRNRGHTGTHVIANYSCLQRKWARENEHPNVASLSPHDILRRQVKASKPDVLFIDDCIAFPIEAVTALVESSPSIRAIVCYHGYVSRIERLVPRTALLLTCVGYAVPLWRELGYNAALLRHAFEPSVMERLPSDRHRYPLTFVGSCSPILHPERHLWLSRLAQELPELQIWTDSFDLSNRAQARTIAAALARGKLQPVWELVSSPLRSRSNRALYGLQMLARLRDSGITLNFNGHFTLSKPVSANMRLFEACGVGTCLVTGATEDLSEIFEPDREVVSYCDTAECIDKIRWLLDHPVEAREIGRCAQARVFREHTFSHRAEELESLIENHLRLHGRAIT